ncbi:SDR family NAD(P)-dependent oxidoreductase [Kineococcus rubinsiae]|uniref:SDR family NAD(P)-dependent oxidoreductase n=1 Tax=Kineococcus rubinsiae TaxID=2609562 RepID=UPI00142F541F|nr:SDR family NAD(P)-dependent oxidoreductase [Kineococcus rubinsiae]NIZ92976.1 SDR family oxidoreductase [Kineococcus rubinsiae]
MPVALLTGAAGGLGVATARRLAQDGYRVVVTDRTPGSRLDDLAAEVGGAALAADLADPAAARRLVGEVEERTGGIDVLVANHAYMTMAPVEEHDPDDWWRVVDTNLGGTFALAQAVAGPMTRRGSGRIVVICSEWGVVGWPGATAYSASKAGLVALVKSLGRELAPAGVVVNGIAPGVVDTPQLQVDADAAGLTLAAMHAEYARDIPLGRIGRPEEIAAAVAFLASPRVGALVGQVLQLNGGSTRTRA